LKSTLSNELFALYIFLATTKVMKPSGSDKKDGGGWWADLPDWLMRREKPRLRYEMREVRSWRKPV
jgi:hypothetical protein